MDSSFLASTLRELEIKQKLPQSRNSRKNILGYRDGSGFCQLLLDFFNHYWLKELGVRVTVKHKIQDTELCSSLSIKIASM